LILPWFYKVLRFDSLFIENFYTRRLLHTCIKTKNPQWRISILWDLRWRISIVWDCLKTKSIMANFFKLRLSKDRIYHGDFFKNWNCLKTRISITYNCLKTKSTMANFYKLILHPMCPNTRSMTKHFYVLSLPDVASVKFWWKITTQKISSIRRRDASMLLSEQTTLLLSGQTTLFIRRCKPHR
jgi:hypothetical protein